jgi:hypothetical protein
MVCCGRKRERLTLLYTARTANCDGPSDTLESGALAEETSGAAGEDGAVCQPMLRPAGFRLRCAPLYKEA